ncbi:MAG: phospholipase D family protein [Candidatus Electrothrix aestuarii]|uniref:Phospholipase D family protein n=1 Tax=Candidatus Electrothrix aestuarii TaxID=3062594 RepID=A0AAU8LYM0_9BACT|nr:phospholipase D family protein [Candidatus Electrothrix aestuarii]
MKIIFDSEIAEAIEKCSPEYIAVAYIGKDWRQFIPKPSRLKSVIISPTLGTNPRAVTDMVNELGWDKIEFLDELHAKLYLGKSSAVTGSSNLTKNGLSGEGLQELCIATNNDSHLKKFKIFFDKMKVEASSSYPDIKKKKQKLNELYSVWNKAVSHGLAVQDQPVAKFEDFDLLSNDQFYITWYQNADCKHSDELQAIKEFIDDEIHFLPEDNIQKNKWVLMWRITNTDTADKRTNPRWLYIHELFKGGITESNYKYTTAAIQRNDLEKPSEPFELTKDVINALKEAVEKKSNRDYFVQGDLYETKKAQEKLGQLVTDMKNIIGKQTL